MPTEDLDKLARESIEAFNQSDWEAVRSAIGPGYVYDETGTGRRIDDIDELIGALQAWKAAFPDIKGEITRTLVAGDTVAMEISWRGTQTGDLDTGAGVIPASNNYGEVWATMWQRWDDDGKLVAERHHLDMLTMLGNIGALPAPV
jgi:steroid delta-isomerase-like uncharacterized protein